MKKIFFLLIILFCFACVKDKQTNSSSVITSNDFLNYMKSKITEDPDASIRIIANANNYPNNTDFQPQVIIGASVNSFSKNYIQDVLFGGYKLSKISDTVNNTVYFQKELQGNMLFGQNVPINMKTDNFDLNTNLYLPKIPELNLHSESVSKSKGYTFYWNKDGNNNLPVLIKLHYNEFISRNMNPNSNFPKEDIQLAKYVEDEGQYTFSPSELSKFPLGSSVTIDIIRGSFSYQKSNGKNILVYGIANNTIASLVVID